MSSRTESTLLKRTMRVLLALAMALYFAPGLLLTPQKAWADTTITGSTVTVNTLAELKTAAGNSSVTVIDIEANISVDAAISFAVDESSGTRNVTINGKNHVIQVTTPYVNEAGACRDSDYSEHNVFTIGDGVKATLNNMTIYGGYYSPAGGIVVNGTLTANNVNISRSYRGLYIGGSSAKASLTSCNIVRNVCSNGGGVLCNGGTLVMDRCSLSENRSTSSSGGGGAIEVKSSTGKFYANNTVIANNCSSEIGGAVNVYLDASAYLMNCTVTGNVTTKSPAYYGGGIGFNGNSFHAVNSIFVDNYSDGSSAVPVSSDISIYSGGTASVHLQNCLFDNIFEKSATLTSTNKNDAYYTTDLANTDPAIVGIRAMQNKVPSASSSVFAGYRSDGILKGTSGSTTGFSHPALVSRSGTYALYAPLKDSGPATSGGVATFFDKSNLGDVKMTYDTNSILAGTSTTNVTVSTCYESATRSAGIIGASNAGTITHHTVKLASQPTGGSVTGITLYGDSKLAADAVSFNVSPNSGFVLESVTIKKDDGSDAGITPRFSGTICSFTMPDHNVIVSVSFTNVTHNVKLSAAPSNGDVTGITTTDTAKGVGSTVSFTTAPDSGYKVKSVTAVQSDAQNTAVSVTSAGSNTYSFTMPNYDVTVTVEFEPIPAPPVYIPEPDPTPSVTPSSPTGVDDFGTISGVSDRMEYKLEGADTWNEVPAGVTQLTGLPAGTYLIRYKGYSAYTKVVVAAAPAYSVEVKPATGGTATADKSAAMKGETVTFSATADEGFNLRGWMVGGEFVEADSITMPAGDIIVEPVFTPVQKLLTAKAKASAKSATLSWKPVEGAVKYRVYLAKADGKLKRVTTIEVLAADEGEGNDDAIQAACAYTSKKLKAGAIYKLRVVAVAEDGSTISRSPIAYVTPKGKSYANATKLSVSKKSVSLGAGEKAKVSAKVIRLDSKGKKLLKVSGVKKIRYMSSEPTIVKVTKYGNITALRAGTAYVYAIAADGVYKRIKVTVE